MSLLETRSLGVRIGERVLCDDLDFKLQQGQCWGVLGGNGIGKTTLLRTLAGLRPPQQGNVLVHDTELPGWNRKLLARKLGMLFQDSVDVFPTTVMESVLCGRYPYIPMFSMETRQDREISEQALQAVALGDMQQRQVDSLSGGERRRLALATLMVQDPDIWLLDEPANHLDLHHQISLLELVTGRVKEAQGGLIMVLHDINLLTRFCSHVMLMVDKDNIICGSLEEVLNTENLSTLYRHPVFKLQADDREFFYPG